MKREPQDATSIDVARRVLQVEADSIGVLSDALDDDFVLAVEKVHFCRGRVIVLGIGKSGLIGRKISATLASTGSPSFFLHPAEASHGDLGMVMPDDVLFVLSYSGETSEVVRLLPFFQENGNYIIAATGHKRSTIGAAADCHVSVRVPKEACPHDLAPTASTTAMLALGDALAIAVMDARKFDPTSFARFHPGGALGRRLLARVEQEMTVEPLPLVAEQADFLEVIRSMTTARSAITVVESNAGLAVITDGDIRRAADRLGKDVFDLVAGDLMNTNPISVETGTLVQEAMELMDRRSISALLVLERGRLRGILSR